MNKNVNIKIKSIGELCDLYLGATPSTLIKEYWENGTIPWMSSGEVNNKIINCTEKLITQEGYDNCSTKLVPKHSVVIALAGQGKTRGQVAFTNIELCTNQSLCSMIPKNGEIDSKYLYHYLSSQYQKLREVSAGDGTRGGLNKKMIEAYLVPLPPLPVQLEIVKILDAYTKDLMELQEKLQAELEARKEQYEYYRDNLLNFNKLTGGVF